MVSASAGYAVDDRGGATPAFRDRLRTRIPSWRHFWRRAHSDRRLAVYDLLPLVHHPLARDAVAALWTIFRPRSPWLCPSLTALGWYRDLCHDGLAMLPPLPDAAAAEIRAYFQSVPCQDPYRPHLGTFPWDTPASPETNMGYHTPQQILAAPGVLALLNDPEVLAVAELYLGAKPLLDNVGAWWSYGDRPAAKGTQRFHRDWDSWRGFKLFFYLTDVDTAAGPHTLIRGSHRDPRLTIGRALDDGEVYAAFGRDDELVLTGQAGTRFIGDTFSIHKGALPTTGRRLLLAAQYNANPSPHLPRQPWLEPDRRFDRDVNRLVMRG